MFYYIYFLCLFSLIFFYLYLFPRILQFWSLVIVTFKFTVLHNNIYRKKGLFQGTVGAEEKHGILLTRLTFLRIIAVVPTAKTLLKIAW